MEGRKAGGTRTVERLRLCGTKLSGVSAKAIVAAMASAEGPFPSLRSLSLHVDMAYDRQAARALVAVIVVAAFPVNHFPARSTILDFVRQLRGGSGSSSSRSSSSGSSGAGSSAGELPASAYAAETLAFCLLSTGIALEVSDLGEWVDGWMAAQMAGRGVAARPVLLLGSAGWQYT